MVDEKRIALTIAVDISYLKEKEQYELYAVMDLEQCTPSLSQSNRLKIKRWMKYTGFFQKKKPTRKSR